MRANHEQNPYFVDLLQNFPTSAHREKISRDFDNDWKDGQHHFTRDSNFTLVDINGKNFHFEFNAASGQLIITSGKQKWPNVTDLRFQQTTLLNHRNFHLTWDRYLQKHCFNQYKIVDGRQVDQLSQYRQDRLDRLYESSIDKWTKPRKESESQEPPHVAMIRNLGL